jgi:phosphatidate phosphatase APP1
MDAHGTIGKWEKVRKWKKAATRILSLVARPVRTAHGRRGIVLQPYRGYGSREEIFLIGRVFRQSHTDHDASQGDEEDLAAHLRDIVRRIVRRSVSDAIVVARFGDAEQRAVTDRDGYFRVHLKIREIPPGRDGWHDVNLVLEQPEPVRATAQVFIPPDNCRHVVISDIDDTVMFTGVAGKLKMLWRLFVQDAESRVAFPGVAAFYRALHAGASANEANPMLYVSRAPWGIYDVLDEFFKMHGIPVGPVLFLREWGITWKSPLPRKAEDHKCELIGNMLALYKDLPFILIGDSGQHDPEVYRRIVDEHPGRVTAVYIRNVSRDETRIREIEELAKAVTAAGSGMVLAADSLAMAEHAACLGLIAPESPAEVRAELTAEGATVSGTPTREVKRASPGQTAAAVADGDLREAVMGGGGAGDGAPNVVIEAERRDQPQGGPTSAPPRM